MHRNLTQPPDLATMLAAVPNDNFGQLLLAYVSGPGRIRNLGGFYWRSVIQRDVVVSLWAGEFSEYRLRRSGSRILHEPSAFGEMHEAILSAQDGTLEVNLLRPEKNDPRRRVIDRLGVSHRLGVVSRQKDTALFTFYLRSEKDGPVTDNQLKEYESILPIAHELISLRHKIVGSEAFQFSPGTSIASLRERSIEPFVRLSNREVEICDCIVAGQSAEATALELGLAVTTVATFRRRAYAKLGVHSTTQLLALVINDNTRR